MPTEYRSGKTPYAADPTLSWVPHDKGRTDDGVYMELQGVWDADGDMIDRRILFWPVAGRPPVTYVLEED